MSHMPLLVFSLIACGAVMAQPMKPGELAGYVKAHYTKYEQRIAMRDGKRLFTAVYVPKDGTKTYLFLLSRTPYSVATYGADKYRGSLGPDEAYAKSGYIFVYQDVRGRYRSEGEFVEMTPHRAVKRGPADIDESTDTYDSIEWLLKNVPGNNGRAGIVGISHPGFYAAAGMIEAHPALKAAKPADAAEAAAWVLGP
jgi:putative CocE/NonD family hydrolase